MRCSLIRIHRYTTVTLFHSSLDMADFVPEEVQSLLRGSDALSVQAQLEQSSPLDLSLHLPSQRSQGHDVYSKIICLQEWVTSCALSLMALLRPLVSLPRSRVQTSTGEADGPHSRREVYQLRAGRAA